MVKEELLEFFGEVMELFLNVIFCVKFENDYEIIVYIVGKMCKNCICVLVGDKVLVEMMFYDLIKGCIIYCFK